MRFNNLEKASPALNFAVVNLSVEFGKVNNNLAHIAETVANLASQGADVVAFPEMAVPGYVTSDMITPFLEPVPGPSTRKLQEIAGETGVLILAGLARQAEGNRYISQLAISGEGVLAVYDKIFLSPKEALYYTAGNQPHLVTYKGWSIGVQLCYDSHFPELSAFQALKGADILFFAFASPHESAKEHGERLMRYLPARAYDNSCYVISCNQSGENVNGFEYPGYAMALDPKGKLIDHVYGRNSHLMVTFQREPLDVIRNNDKAYFLGHHHVFPYEG